MHSFVTQDVRLLEPDIETAALHAILARLGAPANEDHNEQQFAGILTHRSGLGVTMHIRCIRGILMQGLGFMMIWLTGLSVVRGWWRGPMARCA